MTPTTTARETLLDATLPHVAFDGWSEAAFRAGAQDAGMDLPAARLACPRGALDLAVAYHKRGDAAMLERLHGEDLGALRFRDRVVHAIRLRIEAVSDTEAVRRATTLFALPMHAAEGAHLIWGTADAIWTGLGDTSDDLNWYTKRATLSAVYGATVLFWLGDESPDHAETWAFIDRRIGDVMTIESAKSKARNTPILSKVLAGPDWLAARIKAPKGKAASDLPGFVPGGDAA